GDATVRFAVAVLPVPPLVELTFPVVLVYWPEAAPVTITVNPQLKFAAIVAPVKLMLVGAVLVRVPPQAEDVPLATVSPAGSVSVNATPVSATGLKEGLVMLKASEVVPFNGIVAGMKAFAIDGGPTTVNESVAALPVPPSFEKTGLVWLSCTPGAVPVTFTENEQAEPLPSVAPLRVITVVFCVAMIVPPPQVPSSPLGVEM